MRKAPAAILSLLVFAPAFTAVPAKAASSAMPPPQQSNCAMVSAAKGEGKFTGQISGANNSLIEVTSGNETAVVHYDAGGVQVCEGGVPAPTNRLVQGASVTVFGPMKRKGKGFEMTATKIIVAGPPAGLMGNTATANQGGMRPINNPAVNSAVANGGVRMAGNPPATDDWAGGGAAGSGAGGGSQGNQNSNAMRIACNALKFSATAERMGIGQAAGRTSVSGITCRLPVDQVAMQLLQDALTARRLPSVTLSCQNELDASLTNAEISEVAFSGENGAEVVEATFSAQRVEVLHRPSGSKASF